MQEIERVEYNDVYYVERFPVRCPACGEERPMAFSAFPRPELLADWARPQVAAWAKQRLREDYARFVPPPGYVCPSCAAAGVGAAG